MDKELNLWELFHTYRHLADEGKTKHLACPDCGNNLVTMLNRNNDNLPDLWCPICNSRKSPGLDVVAQIQSVVGEWVV